MQLRSEIEFQIPDQSAFFDRMAQVLRQEGRTPLRPRTGGLEVRIYERDILFAAKGTDRITVQLSATTMSELITLRGGVSYYLGIFDRKLGTLIWSGNRTPGETPPNLGFATVVACRALNDSFWQMTVAGDDLERFTRQGLHFSLVRQNPQRATPYWPTITETGAIGWADGAHSPFVTTYTMRAYDARTGHLSFDIFRHPGGVTARWAKTCPIGEVVALVGPTGRWMPQAARLVLAGDETALPAMLRIIEAAAPAQKGLALLPAATRGDIQHVESRSGIDIRWLLRAEGQDPCAMIERLARPDDDGTFYWFAGGRADARRLRAHFHETLGLSRDRFRSAAYW